MGLATSLSSALTGINAAETQIDVIGNNLANSQTVGFKSSKAVFATQFLRTLSLGAAPSESNAGTNPRQVGLGVQVAQIASDFTQGTVQISNSPSDLAIQGDGFFIVQGESGEQLYTRNGMFQLNSQQQLVNTTGQRLLGFGVNDQFELQEAELVPLVIPLGSVSVASATKEVTLEGTLTPVGDVATTAQIIESVALSNAQVPRADGSGVQVGSAPAVNLSGVTAVGGSGGSLTAGEYSYRIVYVDRSGRESVPSSDLKATIADGGSVELQNLPTSADPDYLNFNIYRLDPTGTAHRLIGTAASGATFVDDGSASPGDALETATLTGNYSYVIAFARQGEPESRPSAMLGPQNAVDGRIKLGNFPSPPPPTDGMPAYDQIRIYRNLSNDPNNFYLVDTVAPGDVYTDQRTDSEISNLSLPGNQRLNGDGPPITSNTRLVDVLKRDGLTYQPLFREGRLEYAPRKGGRLVGTAELEITAESTVQDLMKFMEEASGIQVMLAEDAPPIPPSDNQLPGQSGPLLPGVTLVNGRLRVVANNGEQNAVDLDLSAFRMIDANNEVSRPDLAFSKVQSAVGESAVTDFVAYDSLGVPVSVRVTAVLESRTGTETVYRWFADSADNLNPTGEAVAVGSGLVRFDSYGNLIPGGDAIVRIGRSELPSVDPLSFKLDFSRVSGLATPNASLSAARQDGSAPGVLTSYAVGEDGLIRGIFSNGVSRDLGQLQLARFANPSGLEQRGESLYSPGLNSGLPLRGKPGENGVGSVVAGALELSNTDIGQDLVELVLASTQYRSNARVITATQQLLDELLSLRR
jgi:flagellar hook protein FlgE